MTKLGFLALALGLTTAAACGSDKDMPTPGTTPTASGVFPAQAFTGRDAHIEISGDATTWDSSATVSFGAGITVNKVTVASPTDLFADITIDPGATLGARDVTVSDNGMFTLSQAFQVVSPIELVVQGNAGQGGLPYFNIINHDFDNPFDTTTDPNTGAYVNTVVTGPSGVEFFINAVTQYSISGQAFIDLDAAAGPLSVTSGPQGGTQVTSSLGDNFPVVARTGTALTNDMATGTIATYGDSALFAVAATGTPSIVHVALSTQDQNAQLAGGIFVDNKWADLQGLHTILNNPGTVNVLVADLGSETGYNFTINAKGEMLNVAAEADDTTNNSNASTTQTATLAYEMSPATLSSGTDVDVIKVVISAADANKRLHIVTDAGADPFTDTQVDVTDLAGTTSYLQDFYGGGPVDGTECAFGPGNCGFSSADNTGEDVISDMLPAGTYYVQISAASQFDATDNGYAAAMWLE